ncbi:MAG TPA: cytochrome o ubiquinol oxidase subunit IV [Candidatus Paceibacterota bacterium]|nr:cytochrome o ubiquinol oxidase subunit IV [Candidatus Paceibacterota bacterium]
MPLSDHAPHPSHAHHAHHGPAGSYVIGYAASIALTFVSFELVLEGLLPAPLRTAALIALALAQIAVQLVFFLHLSREARPRWHLFIFGLFLAVVIILVGGSWWIMNNLDGRMMPSPDAMSAYMHDQSGL